MSSSQYNQITKLYGRAEEAHTVDALAVRVMKDAVACEKLWESENRL